MKSFVKPMAAAFVLVMLGMVGARADQRSLVWTYEYLTVERGTAEFESYFTLSAGDLDALEETTSSQHQFELEIGMTDRFDFAVYQVFSQKAQQDLKYDGFKLRSRYRLGKKGQYPLDPLLYLEYRGAPNFSEHGVEGKLILARNLGRFDLALNPILELEKEGAEKWEYKLEYAAGLSYRCSPLFRAGLEAKGSAEGHYLGPVIAHGREGLWMALGSALRIVGDEEDEPEFQVRLLLGMGL